ncbi:MAG TPA: hypothetical protein VF017_17105 [Thermoanaerobaculia bacterium]|nr:hypothetical protein [Thermoanaerobaculia bacterium]
MNQHFSHAALTAISALLLLAGGTVLVAQPETEHDVLEEERGFSFTKDEIGLQPEEASLFTETPESGQDDSLVVFPADPNESDLTIAARYYEARSLIIAGDWDEAKRALENALMEFPRSRHLHQQLAHLAWYFYNDRSGGPTALQLAAEEAATSLELALRYAITDYNLSELAANALGSVGDVDRLDELFTKLLSKENNAHYLQHYAQGLARAGDPRAEDLLRKAAAAANDESALTAYAEWLLEHNSSDEALDALTSDRLLEIQATPYLNFLRGVALEQLGRPEQASTEYALYRDFSEIYPAPSRFRIPSSALQLRSGMHFRDSPDLPQQSSLPLSLNLRMTSTQAQKGLSYLIYGEARGESLGGMRAEGWVVRNRVLRGSVYPSSSSCPFVTNSGSALADRYKSVMCQGSGSQFNGMCLAWCSNPSTTSCSDNATTVRAGEWVYKGWAADPVAGHCPGGVEIWDASYCGATTKCKGGLTSYRLSGGLFNYGTSGTCPSLCAPNPKGKVCGNGGLENCFYATQVFVRTGATVGTGTITSTSCLVSSSYSASSGRHRAHLEGPESTSTTSAPDFDLYLQKSSGSSWETVASSTSLSTVEDIDYSGSSGTYRWRVCPFRGTGSYTRWSHKP